MVHLFRSEPLDLEEGKSWLTEIKFRHYLHPKFVDDLKTIQGEWAPFTLILAVREPPEEWKGTIRHIRLFEIDEDTEIRPDLFRCAGERLQDVFERLGDRWEEGTIERAQDAILRITSTS